MIGHVVRQRPSRPLIEIQVRSLSPLTGHRSVRAAGHRLTWIDGTSLPYHWGSTGAFLQQLDEPVEQSGADAPTPLGSAGGGAFGFAGGAFRLAHVTTTPWLTDARPGPVTRDQAPLLSHGLSVSAAELHLVDGL